VLHGAATTAVPSRDGRALLFIVPLKGGRLALGTWQGIFFCELDGPRDRMVYVTTLR